MSKLATLLAQGQEAERNKTEAARLARIEAERRRLDAAKSELGIRLFALFEVRIDPDTISLIAWRRSDAPAHESFTNYVAVEVEGMLFAVTLPREGYSTYGAGLHYVYVVPQCPFGHWANYQPTISTAADDARIAEGLQYAEKQARELAAHCEQCVKEERTRSAREELNEILTYVPRAALLRLIGHLTKTTPTTDLGRLSIVLRSMVDEGDDTRAG